MECLATCRKIKHIPQWHRGGHPPVAQGDAAEQNWRDHMSHRAQHAD